MPYRTFRIKKELEIISLIDVIFMLIIFALVTSLLPDPGDVVEPDLPKAYSIVIARAITYNQQNEPESRLMVSFFDANQKAVGEPAYFPIDDSLGSEMIGRDAWEDLEACELIRARIAEFAESVRGPEGSVEEEQLSIHLKVTLDTRTRIVNYITRACSQFQSHIAWIRIITE